MTSTMTPTEFEGMKFRIMEKMIDSISRISDMLGVEMTQEKRLLAIKLI